MKIIKKTNKIKIEHNKKLFCIIILLIITLIILIYFITQNKPNPVVDNNDKNINCVAATCCHPTECVLSEQAPDCSKAICSMVCSGPLDCGVGHCEFINNKCEIIPNE
jgi:hypothetical protein